jgi:hypothetical protein
MENEENPIYPIDLSIFKEQIRQTLLNILDTLPQVEKTLILEKSCLSKLNYLTSLEPLKERQVRKELIILKSTSFVSDCPIIIYIITPQLENVKIIEKHIESNTKDFGSKDSNEIQDKETFNKYHIIFIPKISGECYSYINDSKYKSYFNMHILNIDIFQLDYDLLSLENKNSFRDIYIDRNLNSLSSLSRAIVKYETVFGRIKYKYSKGFYSKKLTEILNREEEALNNNLNNENETLACFIFDRNIDMITPLCTNYVYEGILDDYIGIDFNSISVNTKILEKESKVDNTKKIDLSEKDKFYSSVKDFNFKKIQKFFPERLTELNKENLDKEKKAEKNSLTNHISISDYVLRNQKYPIFKFYQNFEKSLLKGELPNKLHDFIEDELSKKANEYNLLKIICLESIIHSGIKYKVYEQIKKDFLNIYGYQEIFLWHNLEKMEILKQQDNNNFYSDANKKLQLIFDNVDINDPNDISYTYNGYAPMFIRLVEKALSTGGWNAIKDLLRKIPGDTNFPSDETDIFTASVDKQFILLVFIGGITYGELAAIRLLNKKNRNKKFIVITTGMINTKKIFDSLKKGEYGFETQNILTN